MRHAREPDTSPADEPDRTADERTQPPVNRPPSDVGLTPPVDERTIFYPAIPREELAAYAYAQRAQLAAPQLVAPQSAAPQLRTSQFGAPPVVQQPYVPAPIPGQPSFPPDSPPRGYNRRPLSAPDPFLGRSPGSGPGRRPDGRSPGSRPGRRPPGHSRPQPLTRRGLRLRLPRIRNRRTVVVVTVIAALISANVGLLTIRSQRTAQTDGVPLAAEPAPTPTPSTVSLTNNSTRLGVFKGTEADVVGFERWLGRKVKDVVHFSDRGTWAEISQPNLAEWKNTDYRLLYAVPLLPRSEEPTKEASMRAGARGEFDDYFVTLAENLIADGQEDAVLRVGWEFNLKSWPWGISDHEVFKRYFRHVVLAMRAVPGAEFTIDWNVNNAFNPYDATKYYPGNKYVDYVGVDAYDLDGSVYPYPKRCNDSCRLELQTRAWDEVVFGGERGLDFWSLFAANHKKPMALTEYGLWDMPDGSGGGDNPYFIERMHDFITWAPNNVAYAAYFDVDGKDGDHGLRTSFPVAGKHYLKWFGARKK